MPHSIPRLLQQQPRDWFAREQQQQQQSGSTEFQPPKGQPRELEQGETEGHSAGRSRSNAQGE